jgi:hypothetical protein
MLDRARAWAGQVDPAGLGRAPVDSDGEDLSGLHRPPWAPRIGALNSRKTILFMPRGVPVYAPRHHLLGSAG